MYNLYNIVVSQHFTILLQGFMSCAYCIPFQGFVIFFSQTILFSFHYLNQLSAFKLFFLYILFCCIKLISVLCRLTWIYSFFFFSVWYDIVGL